MKARTKEIDIDGRKVIVRELTVAEVRYWMKDLERMREDTIDLVTEGIMDNASLTDVVRMTDLAITDLDDMTPSEIDTIMATCREVNPHFFKLRQRLIDAAPVIT